VMTSL